MGPELEIIAISSLFCKSCKVGARHIIFINILVLNTKDTFIWGKPEDHSGLPAL